MGGAERGVGGGRVEWRPRAERRRRAAAAGGRGNRGPTTAQITCSTAVRSAHAEKASSSLSRVGVRTYAALNEDTMSCSVAR